ncbi:MAG: FtsH protease activity modulator HflK [Zoogloeaceae bacterium]|jgi:membrane protease subunit HflK|nr:FtsH protease activity modulator HflK [Zoogloeaceae bacterium]
MIPTIGMLMSINDPRGDGNRNNGGRRPKDGPPDLDEIWQDLNRRLGGLFGEKKGGGRPGGNGNGGGGNSDGGLPPVNPQALGRGFALIGVLIFVVWIASGLYIVDASQRGIVLRFGRLVGQTEPGLHWHFPYPIESREIVNLTGVRTLEIGYRGSRKELREALMLTDDENIIDIQFSVQYVLKNPEDYLFKSREPDAAVMQAAETAVREVVGKNKIDDILNLKRAEIASEVSKLMQVILDRYETGIEISKVNMQNAQPPEQVQAAFEDAVKAGQDKERLEYDAQAYASDILPRAEGYKLGVIATAEGDASRFKQILAEYVKAPEVTRQRLYLETMQKVYSNTSKVVVDTKGQGNLIYLPLDRLTQAGAAASAAAGSAAPASGAASVFSGATPPQRENPTDFNNSKTQEFFSGSSLGRERGSR